MVMNACRVRIRLYIVSPATALPSFAQSIKSVPTNDCSNVSRDQKRLLPSRGSDIFPHQFLPQSTFSSFGLRNHLKAIHISLFSLLISSIRFTKTSPGNCTRKRVKINQVALRVPAAGTIKICGLFMYVYKWYTKGVVCVCAWICKWIDNISILFTGKFSFSVRICICRNVVVTFQKIRPYQPAQSLRSWCNHGSQYSLIQSWLIVSLLYQSWFTVLNDTVMVQSTHWYNHGSQ